MTTKETILAALTAAKGTAVSGAQMAERAGVSRAAVWKAICALRDEGYVIDAVTRGGYTLHADDGRLTAAAVAAHLHTDGLALTALPSTDSTNTRVRALAEDGAPEGTVVIAAAQTAGRGRSGKSFLSPAGTGLYMSILLRPALAMGDSLLITTAAAVAVARAIGRVAGCETKIKWVNDVYVDERIVCGILTEAGTSVESGLLEWLVVGIGLNLTSRPEDWPEELRPIAGSLYPGGPAPVSRAALAGAIARELLGLCPDFDCLDEYRARCFVPGHWVTVCTGAETYAAKALSIDDAGRLVVEREGGRQIALQHGEVSIRPTRTG